jgi:glycosyltransferase involved in cell wall biosynthesis
MKIKSKKIAQPQIPFGKSIAFLYESDDACLHKICDELGDDAGRLGLVFVKGDIFSTERMMKSFKFVVLNRIGTRFPPSPAIEMILAACQNPLQRITYYLDDFIFNRFDNLPVRLMENVATVITTTDYLKDYFTEELKIYKDKVIVVPTHIDMRLVDDIPVMVYPDNKFHVLWVSSGIAGLDIYCDILNELSKYDESKNMSFTCITESPSLCRINAYKYPIKQHFLGFMDYASLISFEKGCDLMINPMSPKLAGILMDVIDPEKFIMAKAEVKFVHAGAARKPLITTPNPAYEKCIVERENGYFARDIKEWVDTIMMFHRNPDYRDRIGMASFGDVITKYASSVVIGKYLDAYMGSEVGKEEENNGEKTEKEGQS